MCINEYIMKKKLFLILFSILFFVILSLFIFPRLAHAAACGCNCNVLADCPSHCQSASGLCCCYSINSCSPPACIYNNGTCYGESLPSCENKCHWVAATNRQYCTTPYTQVQCTDSGFTCGYTCKCTIGYCGAECASGSTEWRDTSPLITACCDSNGNVTSGPADAPCANFKSEYVCFDKKIKKQEEYSCSTNCAWQLTNTQWLDTGSYCSLKPGYCYFADTCYVDGYENPANECQICDSSQSQIFWSDLPDGTACGYGVAEYPVVICTAGMGCTGTGLYWCNRYYIDRCSAGSCQSTITHTDYVDKCIPQQIPVCSLAELFCQDGNVWQHDNCAKSGCSIEGDGIEWDGCYLYRWYENEFQKEFCNPTSAPVIEVGYFCKDNGERWKRTTTTTRGCSETGGAHCYEDIQVVEVFEENCNKGWADEYKCSVNDLQRKYKDCTGSYPTATCSSEWITVQNCGTGYWQCCNSNCGKQYVSQGCTGAEPNAYCYGPTPGTCNDCGAYTCSAGSCTSTCSIVCGAQCAPAGATASCTATCTYNRCVGVNDCQPTGSALVPGTQTCTSGCTWGSCNPNSPCSSLNECTVDADCLGCAGTDTSCGTTVCEDCNALDTCTGSTFEDWYCIDNPTGCGHIDTANSDKCKVNVSIEEIRDSSGCDVTDPAQPCYHSWLKADTYTFVFKAESQDPATNLNSYYYRIIETASGIEAVSGNGSLSGTSDTVLTPVEAGEGKTLHLEGSGVYLVYFGATNEYDASADVTPLGLNFDFTPPGVEIK